MADKLLKAYSVVGGIKAFGLLISGFSQWRAARALQTICNAQQDSALALQEKADATREFVIALKDSEGYFGNLR